MFHYEKEVTFHLNKLSSLYSYHVCFFVVLAEQTVQNMINILNLKITGKWDTNSRLRLRWVNRSVRRCHYEKKMYAYNIDLIKLFIILFYHTSDDNSIQRMHVQIGCYPSRVSETIFPISLSCVISNHYGNLSQFPVKVTVRWMKTHENNIYDSMICCLV